MRQSDIAEHGHDDHGNLDDKGRTTQYRQIAQHTAIDFETTCCQMKILWFEEVGDTNDAGNNLANDCGDGGTFDSPVQRKDTDRVKDDVQDSTRTGCNHCIRGTSIGTNDAVHHIQHQVSGKEERNDLKVVASQWQSCVGGTKQFHQRLAKNKTDDGKDDANEESGAQSSANTSMCTFAVLSARTDAQIGGGAVAYAPGKAIGNADDWKGDTVAALPK